MTSDDLRTIALVAIVACAPIAIVFIFAIIRGYRIEFRMSRDKRDRTEDE